MTPIGKQDRKTRDVRESLLQSTRKELIEHGISGARVDRIAKRAKTSKERLYSYFRSKDELIEAMLMQRYNQIQTAIAFDVEDIPGVAAAFFDYYQDNSDDVRLSHWLMLSNKHSLLHDNDPRIMEPLQQVEKIRAAQEAGKIDPSWDPFTLLHIVHSIALAWARAPDYLQQLGRRYADATTPANQRQAVIEAVSRLVKYP